MAVSNPQLDNRDPSLQQPWAEDEIDLRQYVLVLASWWREVVALALVAAVLAAAGVIALRFVQDPVYEAAATVAIARTTSNISFDDNFQTSSSQENMTSAARADVLVSTRRASLVGLVYNGAVAQTVSQEMEAFLTESQRNPTRLLNRIDAELVTAEGTRTESDLIRISARADSPEVAAAIANAWAQAYVTYVNRLYGQVPDDLRTSVQTELAAAQSGYDEAQRQLEGFIASNEIARYDREIGEKQQIVNSLQAGKQTAVQTLVDEELAARRQIISAYINAQASNRLLAFNKEQAAKQAMISALIDAESQSRLNAFRQDQAARQALFDQYVKAELENRALALATDQALRRQVFEAYANADARAKVTVFNEQVDARLQALAQSYDTRQKLTRLLDDARGLRAQAATGGDGGVATNSLAILLLKTQLYSVSSQPAAEPADWEPLPTEPMITQTIAAQARPENTRLSATTTVMPQSQFQLVLDDLNALQGNADDQVADLDAAVTVIESRIAALDEAIAEQSQAIYANQGYALLDAERPSDDPLLMATEAQYAALFDLGSLPSTDTADGSALSEAILNRYNELFTLGPLAAASTVLSTTTPLSQAVAQQYPELFDPGSLSVLTEQILANNGLVLLGEERARELLQLQGLEELPQYSAAAEPLTAAVNTLEDEIQSLQALREAEVARRDQLIRQRDLALKTLTTLNNKNAELQVAGTATNSEVRFGTPALPPIRPKESTSLIMTTGLAGIVGLMLGVFGVFVANFLGARPMLGRRGV